MLHQQGPDAYDGPSDSSLYSDGDLWKEDSEVTPGIVVRRPDDEENFSEGDDDELGRLLFHQPRWNSAPRQGYPVGRRSVSIAGSVYPDDQNVDTKNEEPHRSINPSLHPTANSRWRMEPDGTLRDLHRYRSSDTPSEEEEYSDDDYSGDHGFVDPVTGKPIYPKRELPDQSDHMATAGNANMRRSPVNRHADNQANFKRIVLPSDRKFKEISSSIDRLLLAREREETAAINRAQSRSLSSVQETGESTPGGRITRSDSILSDKSDLSKQSGRSSGSRGPAIVGLLTSNQAPRSDSLSSDVSAIPVVTNSVGKTRLSRDSSSVLTPPHPPEHDKRRSHYDTDAATTSSGRTTRSNSVVSEADSKQVELRKSTNPGRPQLPKVPENKFGRATTEILPETMNEIRKMVERQDRKARIINDRGDNRFRSFRVDPEEGDNDEEPEALVDDLKFPMEPKELFKQRSDSLTELELHMLQEVDQVHFWAPAKEGNVVHLLFRYEILDLSPAKDDRYLTIQAKDHGSRGNPQVELKMIPNNLIEKNDDVRDSVRIMNILLKERQDMLERNEKPSEHLAWPLDHFIFFGQPFWVFPRYPTNWYRLHVKNIANSQQVIKPIPRTSIIELINGVLESLSVFQRHSVTYNNVNLKNIQYSPEAGLSLVSNFDLVHSGERQVNRKKILNDLEYKSPDILNGYREPVSASDMWALGVMLFKLVTGQRFIITKSPKGEPYSDRELLWQQEIRSMTYSKRTENREDQLMRREMIQIGVYGQFDEELDQLESLYRSSDRDIWHYEMLRSFISLCLTWNPNRRMSPEQALKHPLLFSYEERARSLKRFRDTFDPSIRHEYVNKYLNF